MKQLTEMSENYITQPVMESLWVLKAYDSSMSQNHFITTYKHVDYINI